MIAHGRWIVLSLALLTASGCGLQHVAGWLAADIAESDAPLAEQPRASAPPQATAKADRAPLNRVPKNARAVAAVPTKNPSPESSRIADAADRPAPSTTTVADAAPAASAPATPVRQAKAPSPPATRTPQPGIPVFASSHDWLRYGFKDGESYAYRIHIEAQMPDESTRIYDGSCNYTAKVGQAKPPVKTTDDRKPTATAFVVSQDGYLVTCHHVVDGASKLEVAIDGKKYVAKVVEIDEPKDLAILKIDASGLATVPLADSDKIEVGQEVRAIGFPLSSILGDSLKATRGTISGIETRIDRKLLHVDASINPGNSGGPLVNDKGEVVGIASAKLAGRTISNVGFGVPVNDAKQLLEKHKVQTATQADATRLDGPALVRSVSPAVALVTVLSSGPGTSDDGRQITLSFNGSLVSHVRQRALRPGEFRIPRFPSRPPMHINPFARRGRIRNEVVIDSRGSIVDASGGESMPFMLGNLAHFVIEPLSADGQKTWEAERTCTIHEKPADDNTFGPRLMRPRFGPFGPQFDEEETGTKHPARELTEYTLGEPSGDTVVISKQYELKTSTEGRDEPYLQLTGKGDITFDVKQGIPLSMSYQGTVSVNKPNVSVRIPLTVTYKYLDAEALAAEQAAAKVAVEKAAEKAAAAKAAADAKRQFLTPDELTKVMADLESDDVFTRKRALDKLAGALPDESVRPEVIAVVGPLAGHTDRQTRNGAIAAIAVWGSSEDVPLLIEQLESSDVFTRMKVMEALGKLKDERSAEALCERFKILQDRHSATKALEELGAIAEKQVAKLVAEGEWSTRMYACQLLGKIGTAESIPALEAATKDSNGLVERAAQSAIEAINERSKSG